LFVVVEFLNVVPRNTQYYSIMFLRCNTTCYRWT